MNRRLLVAKEAARLLYTGLVEEYIQAKRIAASSMGSKSIPSNYEIAVELDQLADETEGGDRQRRLYDMRRIALDLMMTLKSFNPRLLGSVWRGTARRGSDIDITAFSPDFRQVTATLDGFDVREKGHTIFKGGVKAYYFKINFKEYEAEVVVRDPANFTDEKCGIYGDIKRGLNLLELERLLRVDPLRKFIPERRPK